MNECVIQTNPVVWVSSYVFLHTTDSMQVHLKRIRRRRWIRQLPADVTRWWWRRCSSLGLVFATRRVVCITARCVCSCWMQKMLRAAAVIDMVDIFIRPSSSSLWLSNCIPLQSLGPVGQLVNILRNTFGVPRTWPGQRTLHTKNTAAVILTYRLRNVMSGSTDLDRCLMVYS